MVQAYNRLDELEYNQIPTASNHSHDDNFRLTVDYCRQHIRENFLFGFLQTPWRPTIEEFRQHHVEAIEQVGAVISGRTKE